MRFWFELADNKWWWRLEKKIAGDGWVSTGGKTIYGMKWGAHKGNASSKRKIWIDGEHRFATCPRKTRAALHSRSNFSFFCLSRFGAFAGFCLRQNRLQIPSTQQNRITENISASAFNIFVLSARAPPLPRIAPLTFRFRFRFAARNRHRNINQRKPWLGGIAEKQYAHQKKETMNWTQWTMGDESANAINHNEVPNQKNAPELDSYRVESQDVDERANQSEKGGRCTSIVFKFENDWIRFPRSRISGWWGACVCRPPDVDTCTIRSEVGGSCLELEIRPALRSLKSNENINNHRR